MDQAKLQTLWNRVKDDPKQREKFLNIAKKKNIDMTPFLSDETQAATPAATPGAPAEDEPGILDYLIGTGEMGLMMGTGAVAEPVAGYAGMVAPAIKPLAGMVGIDMPEPVDQVQAIEKTRQALTYQPKGIGAQREMQAIGETIGPAAKAIGETVQYAGDVAAEKVGPAAGAAVITAINAIPELMGIKGTRKAKKMILGRQMRKIPAEQLLTETGELIPEIKRGLDAAGITMDEFKTIAKDVYKTAEGVTQETARPIIEQIAKTGKRPSGSIIAEAMPSKEITQAAREFGLEGDLLLSHTAENPIYRAIEQGLKSVPGSELAAQEKQLIQNMAKRADDLITEFGGSIDKDALSTRFKNESVSIIDDMKKETNNLHDKIRKLMPRNTVVKTDNIIKTLDEKIDELGSVQDLTTEEGKLYARLRQDTKPTYARLDKYRELIGKALERKADVFVDSDEALLKKLYGALAKDQMTAAKTHNKTAGDLLKTANDLVIARKGMEKQLKQVIGKDIKGSITAKAGQAMQKLQKGNSADFDRLLENIPEQLGKETRKEIVASALNDVFVQGSRKEQQLNIAAFDDFMNGINRHKTAKARLEKELGKDAVKRLETFHKVVGGVRRAQTEGITTGRSLAVPKMFDEINSVAEKLYGASERVGQRLGGFRPPGIIESLMKPKSARSITADQLLSSPQFRSLIEKNLAGKLDTAEKIARAEQNIEKLKSYQKWKNSLGKTGKAELASLGLIGYLTSEKEEERQGRKALEEAKQYRQQKEYQQAIEQEK